MWSWWKQNRPRKDPDPSWIRVFLVWPDPAGASNTEAGAPDRAMSGKLRNMAETPENDGPSLELPSLGFGRRKKRSKRAAQSPTPVDPAETTPEETSVLATAEPAEAAPLEPTAEVVDDQPAPEPVVVGASAEAPAPPDRRRATPRDPLYEGEVVRRPPEPAADENARTPRTPPAALTGMLGAVSVGLVIGALTVGLTWGSLYGCEAVQGTSSCGGPGFFLLLAIMIAMIVLGSWLLSLLGIPDPGSTSFLAVGLLAVLALLFLIDVLFSWTMIIVIPLFAMATFALSHWVTASFIEPDA